MPNHALKPTPKAFARHGGQAEGAALAVLKPSLHCMQTSFLARAVADLASR